MKLELLKFDEDFTLSSLVSKSDGKTIESNSDISQLWRFLTENRDSIKHEIIISDDEKYLSTQCIDEEFDDPESLLFTIQGRTLDIANRRVVIKSLFINTIYYTEFNIIDSDYLDENTLICVELKNSLVIEKKRLWKRHALDIVCRVNDNEYNIVEVSGNILKVIPQVNLSLIESIQINGNSYLAKKLKDFSSYSVIEIDLPDISSTKKYFEFYRSIRYPHLKIVHRTDFKSRLALYNEGGFFSSFKEKRSLDFEQKIIEEWTSTSEGVNETSIDYISTHKGKCVATSSLSKLTEQGEKSYWIFSQLCAIKDINTISNTLDQYKWRSEFLSMLT